jgi:predicted heme/steroid binding protein
VFDIARKLAREPSIEIIVSHESAFSANYFGKCGMARANLVNGSDLQYTVIAGDDPLGIVDRAVSSTVTFHSFQDHSPDLSQRYPDILRQTFESWVEGRSGDMLIMASSGYHFGTSPRMAWRLGNHRGSHGGPLREEVTVAAIARGMNSSIDPDAPVHSSDLVERLMSPHLQLDSGRRVAGSLIPQEMTGQDDTSGIDDDVESHFGSVDQI